MFLGRYKEFGVWVFVFVGFLCCVFFNICCKSQKEHFKETFKCF